MLLLVYADFYLLLFKKSFFLIKIQAKFYTLEFIGLQKENNP